jgi:hypothetical protein
METHASALRREMPLGRSWSIEPLDATRVEAANRSETDVVMIESWWWTGLAIELRSEWPEVPIVVRSGGNDAHYAIAPARGRLTPSGYRSWVNRVLGSGIS